MILQTQVIPNFTGRNVPIKEIAEAMHKDQQYVRICLQQGIFDFGKAVKFVLYQSHQLLTMYLQSVTRFLHH